MTTLDLCSIFRLHLKEVLKLLNHSKKCSLLRLIFVEINQYPMLEEMEFISISSISHKGKDVSRTMCNNEMEDFLMVYFHFQSRFTAS